MVGIVPQGGQRLIDGNFVNGLAAGYNRNYVANVTARAGGTKALATQIPAGVALVQLDTVATNGDSALLPQALAGTEFKLANSGVATVSLYGKGTDTINDAATANNYDVATNVNVAFFCAVDGQWKAIKSA